MTEYNLEEGIERIFELIDSVKKKPVVVGIYGHSNAGKTHLRKLCCQRTWRKGLVANTGMVENERSYRQNDNLGYIFLEDYISPTRNASIPFVSKPIDIIVLIRNDIICDPQDRAEINANLRENAYDIVINNQNSEIK